MTIDLDSTLRETYGLGKERVRHHNYTGQRGYHPLLAIAITAGAAAQGTGEHGSGRRHTERRPTLAR